MIKLDFHADPWQINSSSGKRERVCTYKVSVAGVFGATTICSTEKQVKQRRRRKNVLQCFGLKDDRL